MYKSPPYCAISDSIPPANVRTISLQDEETTSLRDYWIVIRKYRRTIATFLLPIVCIAAISVVWKPRAYTATSTLYFESQAPNIIGISQVSFIGENAAKAYYKTQLDLLKSRSLAAQVMRDLGLNQGLRFQTYVQGPPSWARSYMRQGLETVAWWLRDVSLVPWVREHFKIMGEDEAEQSEALLIDRYLEKLGMRHEEESQVIKVQFTSLDPVLSKDIVNAHITAFIRTNLQTRFEETTEARQFLEMKLTELKTALERSEAELNRFRKTHAIVSMEKGENLALERLKALNADLTQARSKSIELESITRAIEKRDSQALSQVIDNPLIRQLKDQISTLEMQRDHLATVFKPTHPDVLALQERVNEAKGRMDQEVSRIVRSIKSDHHAARVRELALTQAMEEQRGAALDLREKAIEASILEREVEANHTLYDSILKKTKETGLTGAAPISNIRVVDRADAPFRADNAMRLLTLLLSVLVGLLGGIGLAFLRHYLDNTVKTPEDVARFLHLPTLSMVPDIRRLDGWTYGVTDGQRFSLLQRLLKRPTVEKGGLALSLHPLSLVRESYQTLCTALLFSLPETPPQTILVTSSQPQEGKTVTAMNVAVALTRNGGSVLLIDADLRNGRCHKILGAQNDRGLTNALTGNGPVTEYIKKTAYSNLYLLSRGEFTPNPAGLLGSEQMTRLLTSLRTDFSFIILDSAPLLPITDTVLLATKVDGVLLVVKAQNVSRYAAGQACERLAYVKAKILGAVLNNIDLQSPEYHEYRGSYASYYAAYATGSHEPG